MVLQVGVKILVKNHQGKYLVLKRSAKKYSGITNLWDIPGGKIETDEELLAGLRRKLREEIGLENLLSRDDEFNLIAAQDILTPEKHVVRLTYWAYIENTPVVLSDEHEDFIWADTFELLKMPELDLYLRKVIDQIL